MYLFICSSLPMISSEGSSFGVHATDRATLEVISIEDGSESWCEWSERALTFRSINWITVEWCTEHFPIALPIDPLGNERKGFSNRNWIMSLFKFHFVYACAWRRVYQHCRGEASATLAYINGHLIKLPIQSCIADILDGEVRICLHVWSPCGPIRVPRRVTSDNKTKLLFDTNILFGHNFQMYF